MSIFFLQFSLKYLIQCLSQIGLTLSIVGPSKQFHLNKGNLNYAVLTQQIPYNNNNQIQVRADFSHIRSPSLQKCPSIYCYLFNRESRWRIVFKQELTELYITIRLNLQASSNSHRAPYLLTFTQQSPHYINEWCYISNVHSPDGWIFELWHFSSRVLLRLIDINHRRNIDITGQVKREFENQQLYLEH